MLPKSVVTRLLIFPMRLLGLLDPSSPGLDLVLLETDLALCASDSCSSWDPTRKVASVVCERVRSASASEPLSDPTGELIVELTLALDGLGSDGASAFTRILKACSKTSWVIMASALTRVRV